MDVICNDRYSFCLTDISPVYGLLFFETVSLISEISINADHLREVAKGTFSAVYYSAWTTNNKLFNGPIWQI